MVTTVNHSTYLTSDQKNLKNRFFRLFKIGIFSFSIYLILIQTASALSVSVDRQQLPINETLQMYIVSNRSKSLDNIDLSEVEKLFDILGRSTQSEFSMVNGRTESQLKLTLTLSPKEIGQLIIPSLTLNNETSRVLLINVTKAVTPPNQLDDQSILLQASLDKKTALINEQVLYTLTIMFRVGLSNAEITSLELPDTNITALKDNTFQRQLNGKNYQVVEKRFALHFEGIGEQTIPSQTLTAVITSSQRSRFGFDPFSRGKQVRLATDPLIIDIQDIPSSISSSPWLPAESITLSERWDNDKKIIAGEPITRSIEILAKGLSAEQLPNPDFPTQNGLNIYPEKPEFITEEWHGGIAGKRVDNFVIIPTHAGNYTLPELTFSWWNTKTGKEESATLPAKTLSVIAAPTTNESTGTSPLINTQHDGTNNSTTNPTNQLTTNKQTINAINNGVNREKSDFAYSAWKVAAIIFSLLWISTLALWLRSHRKNSIDSSITSRHQSMAKKVNRLKLELIQNCDKNNAAATKQSLHNWLAALGEQDNEKNSGHNQTASHIIDIINQLDNPALNTAIDELNQSLFAKTKSTNWEGKHLKTAVKRIELNTHSHQKNRLAPLYPKAG